MSRTSFAAIAQSARALTAALVVSLGMTAAAGAQAVLVMNEEQILSQSAAGQHVATEIQRIRDTATASLQERADALAADSEAFDAETAALSEAELQRREDLRQRFQAMTTEGVELEVERAVLQRELIATQQAALQPVFEALQEVLMEIVNERNAGVVLDRTQVMYAGEAVSITQDAINRLDARISEPAVSRVRMNDEQRAAVRQQVVQQLVGQQQRMQQLRAQQAAAQQQ